MIMPIFFPPAMRKLPSTPQRSVTSHTQRRPTLSPIRARGGARIADTGIHACAIQRRIEAPPTEPTMDPAQKPDEVRMRA